MRIREKGKCPLSSDVGCRWHVTLGLERALAVLSPMYVTSPSRRGRRREGSQQSLHFCNPPLQEPDDRLKTFADSLVSAFAGQESCMSKVNHLDRVFRRRSVCGSGRVAFVDYEKTPSCHSPLVVLDDRVDCTDVAQDAFEDGKKGGCWQPSRWRRGQIVLWV